MGSHEDLVDYRLFRTNLFGPIEMIKAVLPGMRGQKSGAILNVTSIAAVTAVKSTLEAKIAELDKWAELSAQTDYE